MHEYLVEPAQGRCLFRPCSDDHVIFSNVWQEFCNVVCIMLAVAIDIQHIFSACLPGAGLEAGAISFIVWMGNEPDIMPGCNFRGPVRRPIIDNEDFAPQASG